MTANRKGLVFEEEVRDVLRTMQMKHSKRVRVLPQPKLSLYDGQYVIPDFDLQVDLPHEESRYLIECQNRKRSRPQILHKIRYMKALSPRNTFMFVYAEEVPAATREALCTDGVMCKSFEEFVAFVARLEYTLRCTSDITTDKFILKPYREKLGRSIRGFGVEVRPHVAIPSLRGSLRKDRSRRTERGGGELGPQTRK